MADTLHLEGRSKKRLLVDRLETACRRAGTHLSHGKYVMQKHDTRRHCIGDELFNFSKQAAECSHSFEKISC
jgi:peptide methionine sulfoxide reductase MsrB